MACEDDAPDNTTADATGKGTLSRRQILTASIVAAGAGLTTVQAAAPEGGRDRHLVGVAEEGDTAVEFRCHLTQSGPAGESFIAFGYLTAVEGVKPEDLFAGVVQSEATALLTAYASGELSRRIHDGSVHSIDIDGPLTIYQRLGGGASFADPDSFRVGTPVASFAVNLQDVLTVFAPGKGIPTLNGDMVQTFAEKLDGRNRGPAFGQKGARARFFATGLGTLIDPVTLNSVLEMAGNWSTK